MRLRAFSPEIQVALEMFLGKIVYWNMDVRREYLFLQLVCLDLRIFSSSLDSPAEGIVEEVGVEVVPAGDEADADAEEGEAEDEEEGADDDRAGPVAALEAARVHHRHPSSLGIHLQGWSISFLMVGNAEGMLIHFSYPMVSPVRRPQPRPCWLSMSLSPSK